MFVGNMRNLHETFENTLLTFLKHFNTFLNKVQSVFLNEKARILGTTYAVYIDYILKRSNNLKSR